MSLVWRKIQRSNKKAAKYKFVCLLQELTIHCGRKWQPQKVAVAWVHRRRRYVTKDHQWEPSITDPYRGIIVWPSEESENLEIVTTLYRDSRQQTFDDKEWTFIVEGVSPRGKRKALAGISLNLRLFVNELPGTQTELQLKLKPMCEHVDLATMKLVLSCQMLKEGNALDDDMQSVASAMSVSHHKTDIADLSELDNVSPGESSQSVATFSYPSPLTSPDESQPKPLPSEIASIASEIAEAWRPAELPKPKPAPPLVTPTPPVAAYGGGGGGIASLQSKREESRSPRPWTIKEPTIKETPPKVEPAKSPNTTPKAEAIAELPPTGADLLSWCQAVTRNYRGVNVVDFSKCWRNGLAFCALVHRFRPDLIGNFDALIADDIRSNCKKAFDAASVLGVPKIIDPEEMVIMVVPDKIAVSSYVYNLRAALTGQSNAGSTPSGQQPRSLWSSMVDDGGRESASTNSGGSPVVDDRRKSPASVKSTNSTTTYEKSPSLGDQRPLMTRNQLMNPFDSDGEESANAADSSKVQEKEKSKSPVSTPTEKTESPTGSPTPVSTPVPSPVSTPTAHVLNGSETRQPTTAALNNQNRPPVLQPIGGGGGGGGSSGIGDRQEDLKRRARMLLQQFQTDEKKMPADELLSPDDEKRRQELKERARLLIDEAQRRPPNVVKISEMIATANEELWPAKPKRSIQASSSSAPTTRQTTPEHRQYIAQSLVTKESLKEAVQAESGAFDRMKRFGSMRTQELTQSVNFLSSRFLNPKGRRSASVPKELSSRTQNGNNNSDVVETNAAPIKMADALERDTRTREQILTEIEQLTQRQRILDQNAADVEKRWRKAMQDAPGTELEQRLMNEYLSLLNERNMLLRRDMYLNILEKIRDHEERFQEVQRQLGELMTVEESEKTEEHKRQIDGLMDKLMEIVNQRDELAQQLMAHEEDTQEAAELAENMINQSLPLASDDQKNCVIQ